MGGDLKARQRRAAMNRRSQTACEMTNALLQQLSSDAKAADGTQ